MSETPLGRALLDLDAPTLAGERASREQVDRVLARDRGRVKLWTLLTTLLWFVTMLLVFGVMIWFALLFPLQAHLNDEAQWKGRFTPAQHAEMQKEAQVSFMMGTLFITISVGVLAMASLASLLLTLASRRATLRQVNANLLEISEQLKALRQAPAGGS